MATNGIDAAVTKYCPGCGKGLHLSAQTCPNCGSPQGGANPNTTTGDKNRIVAAVLALILGWIGVHKFYLGQKNAGIFYLVFFWTCLPALIAFLEGIGLLLSTNASFDRKYNGRST